MNMFIEKLTTQNPQSHRLKILLGASMIIIFFFFITTAFSQEHHVTFTVDMQGMKDVRDVSIFGSISPLSRTKGYPMSDVDNDGIYKVSINFKTDASYVKFKFANGIEMELDGSDDRVLWFNDDPISEQYVYNEFEYYSQEKISEFTYTPDEIQEDLVILKRIIQYVHPAIYTYRDSLSLQEDFYRLEKEMLENPTLTNAYKSVSKFAAQIKCSHTFTNPWNQSPDIDKAIFYQPDKLPLTFQRLGYRLFIDKNASENDQIKKGFEIMSINQIATDTLLTRLSRYVTSDGSNYEKKLERLALAGDEKFSLFDIFYTLEFGSNSTFQLVLRDNLSGQTFKETVQATSKTNRTKVLKERYQDLETSLKDGWSFQILNSTTAVLKIKSFAVQRNEFDWKKFLDDAFSELNEKSIGNLIIDIRENEGGQGIVGEYILKRIIRTPFRAPAMQSSVRYKSIPDEFTKYMNTWDKFPYDFNGKIANQKGSSYILKEKFSVPAKTYKPRKDGFVGETFLITDASNSSATHLMASYAKQIEGLTIVGQETGGNQLGTNGGFIFFLKLPNTRVELDIPVINMYVPPVAGIPVDGGIQPDIYVEKKWEDFSSNEDREIDAILDIIKKNR